MMSSGAFYAAAAAGDRRNSVPNDTTSAAAGDGQTYEIPPAAGGQPTVAYGQSTTPSSLEGNMAELLEAAAKATTESQRHAAAQQQQQQQQQAGGGSAGLRKVARVTDLRGTAMQEEALSAVGQKRKRAVTPPGVGEGGSDIHGIEEGEGQEGGRAGSQSPRKRARQTPTTEMQHHASSADMHHYHHHQQSPTMVHQQQHQQEGFGLTDARAVGVHSAAALFRQPSASSAAKKHTRPPMSKLFASLQLTPENFLRLQAAAKTYMLDEAHPERQSCVGSRGKGDTDMVKLRLFNCCRDFLNDGIGERFFGPDVPAPTENEVLDGETMPGRKWVWPRDGNKIVSLVTPLLRRMVTNERQRQYAQETRKGTGKKPKTDIASRDTPSQDAAAAVAAAAAAAASASATTPSSTAHFDASHSPPNLAIDPSLSTPQPPQPPLTHAPPPNLQPHYPAVTPPQPAPYGPPPTQYPRFLQTQPPQSIYSTAVPPGPHPTAANSDQDHHQQQQNFHHHHQQQPPPDQNVIQVLITKNNTKLLPRIDMPSWPSTPHHTLPLADLRRAIEEEVRGLLKRGLDLGIRRTSPTKTPTMTTTAPAAAGRAGESVAPATTTMSSTVTETQQQGDVDMAEAGGEEQQQPDMNQQKEAPPVKEGVANDGDGSILQSQQRQQQQQQQQQPLEDEPGIDDITLEIRALTGRGLVLITGDDEWRAVLAEVGRAVWMEGVLRVVVEVI